MRNLSWWHGIAMGCLKWDLSCHRYQLVVYWMLVGVGGRVILVIQHHCVLLLCGLSVMIYGQLLGIGRWNGTEVLHIGILYWGKQMLILSEWVESGGQVWLAEYKNTIVKTWTILDRYCIIDSHAQAMWVYGMAKALSRPAGHVPNL